jgi:predicted DNA-binding protein
MLKLPKEDKKRLDVLTERAETHHSSWLLEYLGRVLDEYESKNFDIRKYRERYR